MSAIKAIIADDDVNICHLLGDILEDMGYVYEMVHNGNDFSSLYLSFKPSLVVLDLRMPGRDGIELIEFIGRQADRPKIIMMSGMDSRTLSSTQKLASMNDVDIVATIQKPASIDELEKTINKITPLVQDTPKIVANDILDGIKKNEFEVFYQPKMVVSPGLPPAMKGVEALLRWASPVHGAVSPVVFIPIAEDHGCIHELTNFVFREVLKEKTKWREMGARMQVSVNISQTLLSNSTLADHYEKMVLENEFDPSEIILELTETSIMTDPVQSLSALTRMRLKGFKLSLDDFGTGYSSMSHLYRMPINELKIDRMFVHEAAIDSEALEIVKFLIGLGESLNLDICLEGVDDEDIVKKLASDRTITIQGFYYSKPLPASECLEFIKNSLLFDNNSSIEQAEAV